MPLWSHCAYWLNLHSASAQQVAASHQAILDLSRLMSKLLLVIHYGGWSDAIFMMRWNHRLESLLWVTFMVM